MRVRLGISVLAATVATLALAVPATATNPGSNGKIAYVHRTVGPPEVYEIWVINPDGSGATRLTSTPGEPTTPSWSPDGKKIAFTDRIPCCRTSIWVMNADGSGKTLLIPAPTDEHVNGYTNPAWSPDGQKLVFHRSYCPPDPDMGTSRCQHTLYTANADGSGIAALGIGEHGRWSPDGTRVAAFCCPDSTGSYDIVVRHLNGQSAQWVTSTGSDEFRDWSPDGTKLLGFGDDWTGCSFTINPDGTGRACLPGPARAWSPDNTKFVYVDALPGYGGSEIFTSNVDGTGEFQVTHDGGSNGANFQPDWQPIPINSYARPKGATPTQVSLVPAYAQCTSPNRTHGPPLAFPACRPPVQVSDELTVGTPDANAKPTKSRGLVQYDVMVGNPTTPADEADVRITVELADIYRQGSLADYAGELSVKTTLRITDKLNTPHPGGPGAATVTDTPLRATVSCAPTADTMEGASCNLVTTADALAPGTVTEGRRAVWELGHAQLDDGGADNDADTASDNTLFMTQGLFVP